MPEHVTAASSNGQVIEVSLADDAVSALINLGYKGKDGLIVKARDRGREFLNTEMLPAWAVNDTWGRTYWDWDNPVMCGTMSMCAADFNISASKCGWVGYPGDAMLILPGERFA